MKVLHGTTDKVIRQLEEGGVSDIRRIFRESNVSLGGTYVTKSLSFAKVYAQNASRLIGGEPVILELNISQGDLLPDEDWVVRAAESEFISKRLQRFMDDLFEGYLGEGVSLSDHYKTKYETINAHHGITWRDSWKWNGTARINRPIHPKDIVRVSPA